MNLSQSDILLSTLFSGCFILYLSLSLTYHYKSEIPVNLCKSVQISCDCIPHLESATFLTSCIVPYLLGGSAHTVKENAEALLVATKEIGLEVNADKTKYMVMSRIGMQGGVAV